MLRTICLTLTLSITGALSAGEPDWPTPLPVKNGVRIVLAEGAGVSREEALKDAFRSAVQQVVKTMVTTETITDSGKLIKNEVLTAAAGMVDGYTELASENKGGVWRLRISARVVDQKLSARLETAKIPLKKAGIDGQGLFATAVSEQEAGRNAARFLERGLKGYPWACCQVETVSYEEVAAKRKDDAMTLSFKLKHSIDHKAYAKVAGWLAETLPHLAVRPPAPLSIRYLRGLGERRNQLNPTDAASTWCHVNEKLGQRYAFIALITSVKNVNGGIDLIGRSYFLDKAVAPVLAKAIDVQIATRITLKEKNGGIVKQHDFLWSGYGGTGAGAAFLEMGNLPMYDDQGGYVGAARGHMLYVRPLVGFSPQQVWPVMHDIVLPPAAVERIRSVEVSVVTK